MDFKVEKNIPPPETGNSMNFPFSNMNVGDSFLVPAEACAKSSVRATVYQWGKANRKKFSVRKVGADVRVWRIS